MSTISSWMDYPPNGFSTTLSSGLTDSGLTISLNSITGLASEGVGVIFKKDADGDVVDTSVEFVHWTSTGTGTVICSDIGDRGIAGSYGSAAQAHDSGDYFEVWVSCQYYTSQRNGFIAEHSAAGVHDTTKVVDLTTKQTLTNKTLTSPTINTPTLVLADTSPTADGSLGFDRTEDEFQIGNGSVSLFARMGVWKGFNPTISGSVSNIGNAVFNCSYAQIGKLVVARYNVVFGSTTTFTNGNLTISLPVTGTSASPGMIGTAYIEDAGTIAYIGFFNYHSTTAMQLLLGGASSTYITALNITNTVPFTWAANDFFRGVISYEAA